MRLEMGNIYIKDIQFADTSKIEDGILYVDKGAVKAVALEDEHIKTVTFDIAKPGESVRITPVKDVIEPRVKVEGKGGVFPGIISKVEYRWFRKDICIKRNGCCNSRKNRRFPGRYH